MKHAVLASIAHNIADSLASGMGLLIGVFDMDVFGEAQESAEGYIEVNFLDGTTSGATPTPNLAEAIREYSLALPLFCERHGAKISDFRRLTARYQHARRPPAPEFMVEIEDAAGRTSRDRYVGSPGARPKALDELGRIRPVRSS